MRAAAGEFLTIADIDTLFQDLVMDNIRMGGVFGQLIEEAEDDSGCWSTACDNG